MRVASSGLVRLFLSCALCVAANQRLMCIAPQVSIRAGIAAITKDVSRHLASKEVGFTHKQDFPAEDLLPFSQSLQHLRSQGCGASLGREESVKAYM